MKKAYIGTEGKLLFSCAVDTVELVLHSLTGEPTKPAVESFSLVDALEGYREEEGSSFSHWGTKYDLNDVLDVAEHIKPETVKMSDVEWNVKDAKDLDADRVRNADTQFPLIAIREKGKIYILDGNHRLRKLYNQGVKEVQIKLIDQDTLDIARLD